jgi:hypothetical protein
MRRQPWDIIGLQSLLQPVLTGTPAPTLVGAACQTRFHGNQKAADLKSAAF